MIYSELRIRNEYLSIYTTENYQTAAWKETNNCPEDETNIRYINTSCMPIAR